MAALTSFSDTNVEQTHFQLGWSSRLYLRLSTAAAVLVLLLLLLVKSS